MNWKSSFGILLLWKFSIVWFYFSSQIFFIVYRISIKFFSNSIIYPKFHCIFLKCIIFYQKRYIFSFIKVFSICSHFLKKRTWRVKFCRIFVAYNVVNSFRTRRDLIRHYYFINVYIFYWNRSFMLMEFLFWDFNTIKLYNCFFHFYIYFLNLWCCTFFSQISIL